MAAKRPREDVEGDDAYVKSLDNEQVVTFYASANEKLKTLQAKYTREVGHVRAEYLILQNELKEYMIRNELTWAKADADVYIRLTMPTSSGKTLCPKTVVDVMSAVKDNPEALAEIVTEVQAHIDEAAVKWASKHPDGTPLPDAAQERFVGKGGAVPQRPLPPLGRPLTAPEILAEVVFQCVHRAHKPKRHKLEVFADKKRGVKKVHTIKEKDIVAAAKTYCEKMELCQRKAAEVLPLKKVQRAAMAACLPQLESYLPLVNAEAVLKRTMPTEEGLRTVTIALEDKVVKPKPASLYQFSEMVDAAVASLHLPLDMPVEEALNLHYDALVDGVLEALETRTREGTVVVKQVTIRRTKVRGDGEEEADEEDESADEAFDDNMFRF